MGRFKSFDEFLDLFPQKPRQRIRGGYNVLCPAHNDRDPSLSVSLNGKRILLDDKAGCPTSAVCKALKITEADLFLDDFEPPTIEAVYQYQDANRKLLFEVVRYTPKAFRQRRPNGKDGYIWNLKGITPVIYRLPDITTAIAHGDTIYITEGEKDADSLWGMGLVATTNPMGAGKWKPEYSEMLSGANVMLAPHNDNEGRKHAISVVNSLEGKVKSIKVIEIPGTAKDVTEWLEQGNTLDDLLSLKSVTPNVYKNTYFNNTSQQQDLASKRDKFGTTSGQDWGIYAKQFDELLSGAGGRVDKREIAETIGLKVTGDTFRKLLARRKDEGKVRAYRGSHYLIEWINKDWKPTQLDKVKTESMLDIALSLRIHEYASLPPRSVVGIAGVTSSGKTSFLLETAELNVLSQSLPVYYWYNEMSEAKMIYRCEDFPLLIQAQQAGKFFPVMQTNFEFADVLQPDAINLIDYIDRDEDVFLIGGDIKKLYAALNNGVVIFALQKKAHCDLGYGGNMSIKLSNLYVTLDIKYQSGQSQHCKAEIIKCKDWADPSTNPIHLCCEYHTGGKHGKLFRDTDWKR